MSHQDITKRQWTCDSCQIQVIEEDETSVSLPNGWSCVCAEIPAAHGVHFERLDLCPDCSTNEELSLIWSV